MQRFLFILILLFLGVQVNAQQFHFKQYSLEQGLSRSGVYDIIQDNNGFLWVATEGGGLCKFDGRNFKTYTRFNGLASEKVRVVFQDNQNIIWLGTTHGISYYDGVEFKSLTQEEDGIADNYIRSIAQDHEGNIWVGSNRGISIIDAQEKGVSRTLKITFSLPHKKVRSLYQQNKVMWIGTDAGLCKYEDGNIEVITKEDGLSNDLILSLFADKDDNLWVGTENGLNKISDTTIVKWYQKDGLIGNRAKSIVQDYKGNIWIGTSKGLSVYNGKSFLNIDTENGLSDNRIRCITTDNFNNIWIGTYFGGIMRFNHQDFIAYTPNEGLISNQIYAITEDDKGDIIVGTYDGVSKLKIFNNKLIQTKTVTRNQGLISNSVQSILKDDNGYYWYGTAKGITILHDNEVINLSKSDGLVDTDIKVIRKINDIYWVGTNNGLAQIKTVDYKSFQIDFLQKADGLSGNVVSNIIAGNDGKIWVSFSDGNLSFFEKNRIITPTVNEDIREITSFVIDSTNKFWIGTNGNGLFHGVYNSDEHQLNLKNLSTVNALSSNYILSILIHDEAIWLGHENGLDLLTANSDSTFNTQTYGPERGFFGLQNNFNASYEDTKGNLWFGTVNGLFCLKENGNEAFTDGMKSLKYIRSIRVNGKYIDWSKTNWNEGTKGVYALPVNLKLPYDQNNISFDFVGLNFISPSNIKYSWKLEGFDKDWKTESANNNTNYTNLDPGKYTFLLKASNEHGRIVGDPITFDFAINKPWWSTILVRILSLILILFIISLIMNIRTGQLKRKQRSLEKTIKERTVEITKQKEELQLKNSEITDSILYSRRIQSSILPGTEKCNSALNDHFVFYKPKDIVSGDFYWVEQSAFHPNTVYFAVADCTGHGVPGAMVSLVGTRALNSSVREQNLGNTAKILDETNKIVLEAFTDEESGKIIKDGMDIALCALDYSNDKIKLQFSGAHNPVWIVRKTTQAAPILNGNKLDPNSANVSHNLFEIKGNKQPIGYFEKQIPFVFHELELQKGDRIYLTSDGYADQFGGERGKKFKYKALKHLILDIQEADFVKQKSDLAKAFFEWQGDLEQLDDVCLMGVEV